MENKLCAFIKDNIVVNVALIPSDATEELLNNLIPDNNADNFVIANEHTDLPTIGYLYENNKFINPNPPEIEIEIPMTPEEITEQIANDPPKNS
jgi:hypothetical protein